MHHGREWPLCTCSSGEAEPLHYFQTWGKLCQPSGNGTSHSGCRDLPWLGTGSGRRETLQHSVPLQHGLVFLQHSSISPRPVLPAPEHPQVLCTLYPLQSSHLESEILSITLMLHNYRPGKMVEQDQAQADGGSHSPSASSTLSPENGGPEPEPGWETLHLQYPWSIFNYPPPCFQHPAKSCLLYFS